MLALLLALPLSAPAWSAAPDPFGEALDFAMRCQRDGHDVRLGIKLDEKTKNIGKGLVEVTADYQKWMRWADVVFMALPEAASPHTMSVAARAPPRRSRACWRSWGSC
jgi:hypothetical protein